MRANPAQQEASAEQVAAADEKAEAAPKTRKAQPAARKPETVAGKKTAAPDDQHVASARQLTVGTWLEFLGSDGAEQRAKLSWVSPITGTLLFTDREGLRAGNYSVDELAQLLRGARARILNAAPLMDRAVSTVLKDYQNQ